MSSTKTTTRRAVSHPGPVALHAALVAEGVSLATYASMVALVRAGGRLRLMKLALHTGSSYWAMRNQVRRTTYFNYEMRPGAKLSVVITQDGMDRLKKIRQRVKHFTVDSAE